jgi:hypothetical protein
MAITPLAQSFYLGDSASLDAFDRLRVSTTTVMLDCKLTGGIADARWLQGLTSGGTITPVNQCAADVACTATAGSAAIFQTKQRGIYQAGRSLMALATFNFYVAGNGTANIRKRVGMFDENDGVFLEQNGTDVRFVLRSSCTGSPVDTNAVTKANWNIDKFDGTGPSGLTLDFTKTQILFADLEWLGVGRVRIGFVINGVIYYAHQFLNTNVLTVPYMSNPNLPMRYECVQTAAANTGAMQAICCTIISEGGFDTIGLLIGTGTGVAGRANLGAVRDEVLAVRLGASFVRRGLLLPESISLHQASQPFMWELVLNPTPTGTVAAGTWAAITDSWAERNITRTATTGFTGGLTLSSGFVSTNTDSIILDLKTQLAVAQLNLVTPDPASDVLSLLVTTLNTTDQTYQGALSWRELR